MAAPKRTKAQRERDLMEVAHLYCAGRRQTEIAAKLGVSQQQVSYDVQRLLRDWRAGHRADIDCYVGETLERINQLEAEYWEAWRRSRAPGRRTVEERRRSLPRVAGATPYQVSRVTVEEGGGCGDPAFLAGVQRCISERSRLLGLGGLSQRRCK